MAPLGLLASVLVAVPRAVRRKGLRTGCAVAAAAAMAASAALIVRDATNRQLAADTLATAASGLAALAALRPRTGRVISAAAGAGLLSLALLAHVIASPNRGGIAAAFLLLMHLGGASLWLGVAALATAALVVRPSATYATTRTFIGRTADVATLAVALTLAAGVGHLAFDRSPRSSVLAAKALLALVALAAAGFGRARLHRLLGAEPSHERTAPAWVIPPEPPPNFTFTPDVRRAAAVQVIALALAAVASAFLR